MRKFFIAKMNSENKHRTLFVANAHCQILPWRWFVCIVFFALASANLRAQETFIKRYKNTTISEGSVAVAELPGNRIAIVGRQANGFDWHAPMVIITDSAGNQLRHFMDSACWACNVCAAVADSKGYIYVAGKFFNKAGVLKYDTMGNRVWFREFTTNGLESGLNVIKIVSDSILLTGGEQYHGIQFLDNALIVAFNTEGDTLWYIDSKFGHPIDYSRLTISDLNMDSTTIYATGLVSDTLPNRVFLLRVTHFGQPIVFQELPIGRKMGYGIVPLAPDTILIGGYSSDMYLRSYCFVALVDSNGLVLETIEDSAYLDNFSTKMRFDRETQLFYMMNKAEKIYQNGSNILPEKISAYTMPITNLQQPLWEKTITNANTDISFTSIELAKDGTLLHSAFTAINCPHCPYLLKTDANTCADLVLCDTAFVSSVSIAEAIDASLRIYPNPFAGGSLHYQLESSTAINDLSLQCVAINGSYIANHIEQTNSYTAGEIHFDEVLPSGVYFLQFLLNGQHKLYSRVVKIE